MTIIWDGTPHRPGGRMLFAEEGPITPTPEQPRHTYERRESQRGHRTGSFAKVRAVLPQMDGWFDARTMALRAKVNLQQARCALYACWEDGLVEKSRQAPQPMRYRWVRGRN